MRDTSRREALGLLGGFAALAIGAAPLMHARADLALSVNVSQEPTDAGQHDMSADVVRFELQDATNPPTVGELYVELTSREVFAIEPLFFSWDQKRKTRHNWDVQEGPKLLQAGEKGSYRISAPSDEGRVHVGYPAQLTVFDRGKQRWKSVHFTIEGGR